MVQEFSQVSRLHLQLLQRYRDNEILVTQQKTNIGYKHLPNTCNQLYRVAHKNVPKFAIMLYCSTTELKQKNNILKSNDS